MGRDKMSLLRNLKRAMNKIQFQFVLGFWRMASIISTTSRLRRFSFNDRMGLHSCIEDEQIDKKCEVRELRRTQSYASDDDVDKRAEIFIANFRRQLCLERQVSLQLRYCRGNSFEG
ncbi:DUF761 domain-containing protein [Quillaja saponaria]|uniref:DUF761 domain-containing protein n=1 Tax=Quillaja saponaria TaxID=32244 RepID=A0AAD7LXL6_QUISA|nr:DUF761 domain-containing protein [Quillaja saponaria]